MRTTMRAAFGLAFAAGILVGPAAFANGCSGGAACGGAADRTQKGSTSTNVVKTTPSVSTSVQYKDVPQVQNRTVYKDVTKTTTVDVVNKKINVTQVQPIKRVQVITRIQPIIKTKTITRVNNQTVYRNRTVTESKTITLAGKTEMSYKTVTLPAKMESIDGGTVKGGSSSKTVHCNCSK